MALQEPTLDEAAAEVMRRRQARENFSDFMAYMHGKPPPRHMEFLCNKLQEKMTRKGDRLLVCFPPGHGKSTVSSLYYPAFYLSKNPTHNIITVSHTESFAEQWGRKVRNIMLSDEYKMLFPEIEVSDDSRSAGRWDLKQGGSYYATGVGGTVTGRRADCLVGSTLVTTQNGLITICDIHEMEIKPKVLAYDHVNQHLDWCAVVASRKIEDRTTINIRTFSGHGLRCTPDHRIARKSIYNDEYTAAGDLSVGDLIHVIGDGPLREHTYEVVNYISLSAQEDVYDIQVSEHQNFIANGILVHNCVICDDLLKGIDDAESKLVRDNMWDWWGSDLSTRLKPSGVMVIIGTRWHLDDIIGRVMAAEKQKGGDKWDKVILPALAKEKDPLGRKVGEALWPEWESEAALARRRAQPSMTARQWESLYQQSPVLESGNIIKRDWIKIWNQREPPKCDFILQSWDTAITSKNKSAYSVCLTFGIFTEDKTDLPSVILLSRWRGRVDYPDLRKMAQRLANHYLDDNREVPMMGNHSKPPDMILIEAKATGEPLIADLNRAGIAATRFNPNKHGDKNARLLLVTDIFENGRFYVPGQPPNYTLPRRWAEEYVNSLMSFPASDSRDDADATSQAIIRMKTSGWIKNSLDAIEEEPFRVTERANGALYG